MPVRSLPGRARLRSLAGFRERAPRTRGFRSVLSRTGFPLAEFDILGFSLLYELNYSNILTILDLGGIPLFVGEKGTGHPARHRRRARRRSIPEPVADIFDLFLLGDGEEAVLGDPRANVARQEKTGSVEKAILTGARPDPGRLCPFAL